MSLSGHAPLALASSGHMTDTGEYEGQRGWLAPEVKKKSPTRLFPPPPWKQHRLTDFTQWELRVLTCDAKKPKSKSKQIQRRPDPTKSTGMVLQP